MSDEGIVCRFVFTTDELKRAMSCYWRHSPHKWWIVGLVALVICALAEPFVLPDHSSQATAPSPFSFLYFLQNILPMVLFVGLMIFLIVFQTNRSFRKGAYFNQEMIYTFRETGVFLQTPRVQSEMKWEIFPRVLENKNGFVLFNMGKRSFNWFPKNGFASSSEMDECRELFRTYVKDSKCLVQA
jgi:hypothetical protein